jgi:hypothetical protein
VYKIPAENPKGLVGVKETKHLSLAAATWSFSMLILSIA